MATLPSLSFTGIQLFIMVPKLHIKGCKSQLLLLSYVLQLLIDVTVSACYVSHVRFGSLTWESKNIWCLIYILTTLLAWQLNLLPKTVVQHRKKILWDTCAFFAQASNFTKRKEESLLPADMREGVLLHHLLLRSGQGLSNADLEPENWVFLVRNRWLNTKVSSWWTLIRQALKPNFFSKFNSSSWVTATNISPKVRQSNLQQSIQVNKSKIAISWAKRKAAISLSYQKVNSGGNATSFNQ